MISILEMATTSSQSPRDRILWILIENGGKMELSRLRKASGLTIALLNPIRDDLIKEGWISLTGKDKEYHCLNRTRPPNASIFRV